jgi:hypothetical protein
MDSNFQKNSQMNELLHNLKITRKIFQSKLVQTYITTIDEMEQ